MTQPPIGRPWRYRCQPDGVVAEVKRRLSDPALVDAEAASERLRVRPQFTSEHYGAPAYAQLSAGCAVEIGRGADDESEMGVYHDLYQPQRAANLRTRLAEATPAGMHVGLIFTN